MKRFSCESFGDFLIRQGVIEAENQLIYVYGLQQGLIMVIIMTNLILGCIMGMAWQSMAYLIAYVPLRAFAGGFHAKTPLKCYLFSIILMIAALKNESEKNTQLEWQLDICHRFMCDELEVLLIILHLYFTIKWSLNESIP